METSEACWSSGTLRIVLARYAQYVRSPQPRRWNALQQAFQVAYPDADDALAGTERWQFSSGDAATQGVDTDAEHVQRWTEK